MFSSFWSDSPFLCSVEHILAVSLPYLGRIFAVCWLYFCRIFVVPWPYHGLILAVFRRVSLSYLGRILTYLGRNLAVSLSHIGRILTVNWLYLGSNLEVFWPYYWPYFEEYLGRILDSILAVFWCLFRHVFVALAFQCPQHLSSLLYSLDYHAICCDKITMPLSNIESRRWKSGEPVIKNYDRTKSQNWKRWKKSSLSSPEKKKIRTKYGRNSIVDMFEVIEEQQMEDV